MRLAVLSDIHDNVWTLEAALAAAQSADALVCCGDLCSPFIVHQIGRGFAQPVHIVFGNNDGDRFRIANNARHYPHLHLHGEWFRGEFDGRRVAAHHFDNVARAVAASGEFDLLCFGHNHRREIARAGKTLLLNPGAVMGATFAADGSRTDVDATFAYYDTVTGEAEIVDIAWPASAIAAGQAEPPHEPAGGRRRKVLGADERT